MQYSPDYQIKLPGKTIGLLFNTLTYRKYCERNGLELEDLIQKIRNTLPPDEGEVRTGVKFMMTEYPDIMLMAHQSFCIYNDLPFTATEKDSNSWVDELGGIVLANKVLSEMFLMFVSKLLTGKSGVEEPGDKKKVKKNQPGEISSKPVAEQA